MRNPKIGKFNINENSRVFIIADPPFLQKNKKHKY